MKKIAGYTSTLLWIAGLALAFALPSHSPYLWLSDAFLLLGFLPLMVAFRIHWLIFLFGLFNTFIGFFLLILTYLESEKFVGQVLAMKQHLLTYHSPWVWILLGGVPFVLWGGLGTLWDLFGFVRSRARLHRDRSLTDHDLD